jgi:putative two-component system response regulator
MYVTWPCNRARDFLTKPVDKVELTVRVRNLLALRKSSQQLANRAAWLMEEVKLATAEIRAREKEAILRLSRAAEYRDRKPAPTCYACRPIPG